MYIFVYTHTHARTYTYEYSHYITDRHDTPYITFTCIIKPHICMKPLVTVKGQIHCLSFHIRERFRCSSKNVILQNSCYWPI